MDEDLLKKLSDLLSEKNIDLEQVLGNFQNSADENPPKETSSSSGIDMDTLLKIQKLAGILSNSESSKDETLLRALKPYMRDSRKEKIDHYIKMLHILNVAQKFQEMGGNLNDIF